MLCNPTSYYPDKIDDMTFFQDVNLETYPVMKEYERIISSGKYDEANEYINQQSGIYGYFADFFNLVENRIYTWQNYLLNKKKINPFTDSDDEPTELTEGMYWIQIQEEIIMAVNEEIVTGKKFRRLIDIATNKWRRYSFWNKAKDTECEDGTDVETKVGAIKGITTSTNVSETGYAADAKTVSEINQSLTNLKNPAKGTKGILVNGGSPLSRDFLLCYTLQSTNTAYSGASISINGINVAQLTSQSANCKQTIVGSVRAFKGDIISITISNFGGDASVYAYC